MAESVSRSLGEFELIARLTARLRRRSGTILGPGDDCAILKPARGRELITIDSMVEGVHFRLDWGTPESLGARALTVNLSDIAAMGGRPTACVVNLAIRPDLDARFFDRLYAGMARAADAAGVDIVGGNVTRAAALSITIALLGEARGGVMTRGAARPGDHLYVTGTLGDAALGWRVLDGQVKARGAARRFLIDRYLNPIARVAAGMRLARIRPAPAAIDISDGLWQDLGHLLERSGVGAEIDARSIPLSPAYRTVAGGDLKLALGGGEDYELLFALRKERSEADLTQRLGVPVSRIGRIVRGRGARLRGDGAPAIAGWDQLKERP